MLFIAALFLSCLVTLFLARYAWARSDVPTARAVTVLMLGISWWTLCYALALLNGVVPELIPEPPGMPVFWFRMMFVGVVLIPASFLIFMLQYTGTRERIRPRLVVVLSIMPVLTVFFALTDGTFHKLFLGDFAADDGPGDFRGGPVFLLHIVYSYLLSLVAYVLLIRFIIQTPAYRTQAILLLIGTGASTAANVMTILQAVPDALKGLDISPFGFFITAVVMFINIRKEGFLDVMPIARSVVFENMADGILVTDAAGRLVDRNPAALKLFESGNRSLGRGHHITDLVPELFEDGKQLSEVETGGRVLSVQHDRFFGASGAVRGHVYGFRDVTELKETEAHLREQLASNEALREALKEESIRDPLTGLYNRRWLDEVLEREIPRALREKQPLTFCIIDLDHFKQVNDNWGHDAGDRILVTLARLLQEGSRKQDVAARFGGEEFVLVLPGLDGERAREVVERLKSRFGEQDFGPDGPANLTFSAGLACVPAHACDRETLLRLADRALYRAKDEGRDRGVIDG
ncbi:MAG: diguanylate cyclase, partial [Marinobacter sp.]